MEVMSVFCRNFQKTVKFSLLSGLKYEIPSHLHYSSHSYSSVFSCSKLKYNNKINYYKHFPSANFWTSIKLWNNDSGEEDSQKVKIVFVRPNGEEIILHGKVSQSVMQAAIQQQGIMQASCDGQLACTTCHVYVDPKIKPLFPVAIVEEDDLLDNAPFCKPNSRLSCQLILTADMKELRFGLPAATTNMYVDVNDGKKKKNGNTKENRQNEDVKIKSS